MWSQAKESLGLFGTHQKLEEARKVPLLDLLEPLSHIGFRPGSQTTQECIAVGTATQFGMLCSDCPINAAIATIILTKCLSPVFTSLGTQKGVCFKQTPASFSGCYLSSHRMPLLLQLQSPLSHPLWSWVILICFHIHSLEKNSLKPYMTINSIPSSLDLITTKLLELTIFLPQSSQIWDYNKLLFLYVVLKNQTKITPFIFWDSFICSLDWSLCRPKSRLTMNL